MFFCRRMCSLLITHTFPSSCITLSANLCDLATLRYATWCGCFCVGLLTAAAAAYLIPIICIAFISMIIVTGHACDNASCSGTILSRCSNVLLSCFYVGRNKFNSCNAVDASVKITSRFSDSIHYMNYCHIVNYATFLTTCKAAWFIILVDSLCLSVRR